MGVGGQAPAQGVAVAVGVGVGVEVAVNVAVGVKVEVGVVGAPGSKSYVTLEPDTPIETVSRFVVSLPPSEIRMAAKLLPK